MLLAETLQESYVPVLLQVIFAIGLPVTILAASHIFGQRAKGNYIKDAAYECGILAEDKPHPRFAVKFYITAMLFILFDIEVVFLVPWALIYRDFIAENISIVAPILVFMGVIILGLVYEIKQGALEWDK
jgi:NADH-quinone oxidoreductase subunit A